MISTEKQSYTQEQKNICLAIFYKGHSFYNLLSKSVRFHTTSTKYWVSIPEYHPGMTKENAWKVLGVLPQNERNVVIILDERAYSRDFHTVNEKTE